MNVLKRVSLSALFVFAVLAAFSQAKISFKNTSHDFGEISEEKGMAYTTYSFTNTGDAPLIVNNVTATCGCTTPEWTREPIAPGKAGEIKVGYNPQNRPGSFRKSVNVYSNTQPAINVLSFSGNVTPKPKTIEEEYPRAMGGLRFKTNFISIGNIPNTQKKEGELEFINNSDKTVKAEAFRVPGHLSARFEPKEVKPGEKGKFVVEYDGTRNSTYGLTTDRIYLSIDGARESNYTVTVSATVQEDFGSLTEEQKTNAPTASFDSQVFDFGTLRMGQNVSNTFKLTNKGKTDLLIRNVRASCGCTTTKNANVVKPGETIDFTVTFNSQGKRGRQNRSLTVITNDPNNSSVVLRMIGEVEAK